MHLKSPTTDKMGQVGSGHLEVAGLGRRKARGLAGNLGNHSFRVVQPLSLARVLKQSEVWLKTSRALLKQGCQLGNADCFLHCIAAGHTAMQHGCWCSQGQHFDPAHPDGHPPSNMILGGSQLPPGADGMSLEEYADAMAAANAAKMYSTRAQEAAEAAARHAASPQRSSRVSLRPDTLFC